MFFISTPFAMMGLYSEYPTMIEDPRLVTLNTPWNQALLLPKRDPSKRILTGLQQEEETVASVLHGGGIVATGTDSPLADVATAFHLALRAEVKYGLSPCEALQTATILPAKAFGVDQDLGTVEAGKIADLAIVDGNPLHHIEDVANVRSVMKDGRVYSVVELMAPFTLP
jgi:imidazolonepropionase-like amidohydrolase